MQVIFFVEQFKTIRSSFLKFCSGCGFVTGTLFFIDKPVIFTPFAMVFMVLGAHLYYMSWQQQGEQLSRFENDFQKRVKWSLQKHGWALWWSKPVLLYSVSFAFSIILCTIFEI